MKHWLLSLTGCLVVAVGIICFQWVLTPKVDPATDPPMQTVDVTEGLSFAQVAEMLDEKGLLRSRDGFVFLAKVTAADRQIRPGEYAFHAGMAPRDILADLQKGRVIARQVTIPEGFTVDQIAGRLAEREIIHGQEFLKLTREAAFISSLDLTADSLEGYLFPTTYRFAKYSKPENVIRTMVAFTRKAFTSDLRQRAEEFGMSMHEVLTLASVIEKETGAAVERSLISAVFHNRLRRGMRLQSDPTVIYGLASFDGNLRKDDLSYDSPYNTYRVNGLPHGPIANPGAEAIQASLYPAEVSYLYFVSRNDGTHHFSSTFTEHKRAVNKYQRRRSRRTS